MSAEVGGYEACYYGDQRKQLTRLLILDYEKGNKPAAKSKDGGR